MHFLDLTLGIRFEPVLGGLGQFLSGGGGLLAARSATEFTWSPQLRIWPSETEH